MKKCILFFMIMIVVLLACQADYIDTIQRRGIVKDVNDFKINIDDSLYDYTFDTFGTAGLSVAPGDSILYFIRNYKNHSVSPLLYITHINGSKIK